MIDIEKILVVCSSEKGRKVITGNLKEFGYTNVEYETNGASARRRLIADEYNLVIIDTPLQDELGSEIAIKVSQERMSGVIVTVKAESEDSIGAKLEEYGVFVVSKPFPKIMFYQAVKFVFTSLKRLNNLKSEQVKLQSKVEDIRIINKAKCLLIQYGEMSEVQAHKYLEKQAMDERLSRRAVAENVINYYEV